MSIQEGDAFFIPARTVTATGFANGINVNNAYDNVTLQINVTAASGTTPTLALGVQWSVDGVNWSETDGTPDTFAASITGVTSTIKRFQIKGPFFRLKETVGGTTPSFTYSVGVYKL